MSGLRQDIEAAIERVVGVLADAVAQSGMTKDDNDDLKTALRKLVVAIIKSRP